MSLAAQALAHARTAASASFDPELSLEGLVAGVCAAGSGVLGAAGAAGVRAGTAAAVAAGAAGAGAAGAAAPGTLGAAAGAALGTGAAGTIFKGLVLGFTSWRISANLGVRAELFPSSCSALL